MALEREDTQTRRFHQIPCEGAFSSVFFFSSPLSSLFCLPSFLFSVFSLHLSSQLHLIPFIFLSLLQVLHVGHECDLAMLTVEDDTFWEGLEPLPLGDTPHLQQDVRVVGYPTGGDNVSVTKVQFTLPVWFAGTSSRGRILRLYLLCSLTIVIQLLLFVFVHKNKQGIVSRIGVGKYSHGDESLLVIQIDAAINSGNSGGPALSKDEKVCREGRGEWKLGSRFLHACVCLTYSRGTRVFFYPS